MFEYKLVHQEHQRVVCFVRRINQRKVKGVVDWAAEHTPYIALWNTRIQQHYIHDARHRRWSWMEYLRWLQQQSWMFHRPAYTEDDIAQLPDSDGDNEVIDEYDEMTRQGTIQPERGPFQNYVVSIFFVHPFYSSFEIEVHTCHYCHTVDAACRWANEASEVLSHLPNSVESHSALHSFVEVSMVFIF
jgi:hypothetical protein